MSVVGLAVMARAPRRGRVKTRLARAIGDDAALLVYENLLRHVRQLTARVPDDWIVRWFIADQAAAPDAFADIPDRSLQRGDDLGARMQHAFASLFDDGCAPVLMIGTDCPAMTPASLHEMVRQLQTHDVAIIPAQDGGYVAIGLKSLSPQLFEGPAWGTDAVLDQTLQLAAHHGRTVALLPPQTDLDDADDLSAFPWLLEPANAN